MFLLHYICYEMHMLLCFLQHLKSYIQPRDVLASSVKLQVFPNMQGMDHPAVSSHIFVLKPAVTSFRSWMYIYPDSCPKVFKGVDML